MFHVEYQVRKSKKKNIVSGKVRLGVVEVTANLIFNLQFQTLCTGYDRNKLYT